MDDVPGRKVITAGDLGLTGLTAIQGFAFSQQVRAGSTVDRPVDAPAAEQTLIGRIDDRIDLKPGDIPLHNFDFCRHRDLLASKHSTILTSNSTQARAVSLNPATGPPATSASR